MYQAAGYGPQLTTKLLVAVGTLMSHQVPRVRGSNPDLCRDKATYSPLYDTLGKKSRPQGRHAYIVLMVDVSPPRLSQDLPALAVYTRLELVTPD